MRGTALSIAVVASCSSPPQTPPTADKSAGHVPVPDHSPAAMRDPGKPRRVSARGTLDVDIAGQRQHFAFFPRGENAAVHFEETAVSWVQVKAALTEQGHPSLTLKLEPLNLGALEFPAEFGGPELQAVYKHGQSTWSAHATVDDAPFRLTLEGLDGRTLRGRFEGMLSPTRDGGQPLHLERGMFSVELRLTHIKPAEAKP